MVFPTTDGADKQEIGIWRSFKKKFFFDFNTCQVFGTLRKLFLK